MKTIKGMAEVGKEINSDQKEGFVNHEGLKRVYKPQKKKEEERLQSAKFGG
jgi:hypothetical protein